MKVLVTGGAGYIGSFMVDRLISEGKEVVVLDNLKRGHKNAVNKSAEFIEGDVSDENILSSIFSERKIEVVLHFAGLISVEESTKSPDLYYENNVIGSRILFETAIKYNISKFVFSSSAAVYGNPTKLPIPEAHPKNPTNPYGKTKLETEEALTRLRNGNSEISFACLRYFNAAGASLDGSNGENHDPETHIIPLAIKAVLSGGEFKMFGTDYNTPDGTCIRDYIHVLDLVDAHILAMEHIVQNNGGYYYNVGTGKGISNKEVVGMVEKVSRMPKRVSNALRRPGDADRLIADPTNIKSELGFSPKYSDLETIVKTAWQWHSKSFAF